MGKEKLLNSLIHNQAHYAILGGLQIQISSYTLHHELWQTVAHVLCTRM